MNKAELEKSLALWKRREAARKKLHTEAQQDLMEARAVDEHPRQDLVDRRNKRSEQLKEARGMIARRIGQLEDLEKGKLRRPRERIVKNVRNRSNRNGVEPKLIVLHSTESHNRAGLSDLAAIVSWFDNPGAQASSHVIVDDEGMAARCVPDDQKAWTQAFYNPQSLSIEQIGFASQGKSDWTNEQIDKTAKYIAYWSKKYNIPITISTTHGVCTHKMLGAAGGGHVDPGPNFPLERCLKRARHFATNGW